MDRRARKKEKTRQALLDVAIRLIAERGIYGTRIEDITERSDLGKGAFYNYFESKDHLVAELVLQGVELLHDNYLANLPVVDKPSDRVAAVVAAHESFFDDHPAYVVLFHQARGLVKVRAGEREVLASAFVEYLRRIGAVIVDGAEPHDDARLLDLAAVILGTIAGYRSFRLAAGLGIESTVVAQVLGSGLPSALSSPPPAAPSAGSNLHDGDH